MAEGWLYDGASALRHPVIVDAEGNALRLAFTDGRVDHVPAAELIRVGPKRDAPVYRREGVEGWSLAIDEPAAPDLAAILPKPSDYGRWVDRIGLWPAVGAGVLVSAVVLGVGYLAPGWLAPFVPHAWEQRFGDALVGDFGGKFCAAPAGQAALERLTERLAPGDDRFNVRVVDIGMVNAAALPGGNIVIFRELIDEAESPDEVAGVLAHEIAHVRERHVTEALIRHLGVGLVVASLGGTTGANADTLVAMSYSRDAETEADQGAIEALAAANISPRPAAGLFARLATAEADLGRFGEAIAYVSSHPSSDGRRAVFERSADSKRDYRPALSRAQWRALQTICESRD